MDISNMHCKNSERELAIAKAATLNKTEFEEFYISHTIEETLTHYNISLAVCRLIRKLFDIEAIPLRHHSKRNYKSKIYNNGFKEIKVKDGDLVPDGFFLGGLPKSDITKHKLSESKKGKIPYNKGKKRITDGKTIVWIDSNSEIPENFTLAETRSKGKVAYTKDGKVKYFQPDAEAQLEGWVRGDANASHRAHNSLTSKLDNIAEFERTNNCTLYSTAKRKWHNSWYSYQPLIDRLHVVKWHGYKFIDNNDLQMIKDYIPDKVAHVRNDILGYESTNNCTSLQHLVEKYGQLQILTELPRIKYKKYNFISNEYIDQIELYLAEVQKPFSHQEKDIVDYIKSIYDGEIIENCRRLIRNPKTGCPLELDLYLPEKHLAIEYNGLYWHSSDCGTPKDYHELKAKLCAEQNVRLIQIYQDEWLCKTDKIKQLLNISLGNISNIIYARKCDIRLISNKEAEPFSNKTHLQGHRPASITYGLFYNNELVQLMSFAKTANAKRNGAEWEIIRGCPGSNNIVVGGVSKLFTHFLKMHNPGSIFSYCDFNKFDGKSYVALGMEFIGYTGPDKYWIIDGHMVNRNPKKHAELKAKAQSVLYGAGSKKYIWRKEI